MPRKLLVAPGGVAAEMGQIDPRAARRQEIAQGETRPGAVAEPAEPEEDEDDYIRRTMTLRREPGQKGRPKGRVKWYHTVRGKRCWAFTTPKKAWEDWRNGETLRAARATYPDGSPVVPPGSKPEDVVIRCGSCGTHTVEFLQLLFYEI